MYQIIKFQIMELNPFRLKRLLLLKEQQLANVNNGWGNTHYELLDAKKEIERLTISRNRWHDIAVHFPEKTVGCPECDYISEFVRMGGQLDGCA